MSAAQENNEEQRPDFGRHDWASDAQWQRYLQGVELPAQPALEAAALRRLKRKYWLRSVDPSANLPPDTDTPPPARTTHSSSSSTSAERSSSSSTASSQAEGGSAASSARQSAGGRWPWGLGLMGAADAAANVSVVLSALALLLAGVPSAYRWLLLAVCATCALHLYRAIGAPQFSREYLARLMANDSTPYLLLGLVFLSESPVLLLVPVVAIYALINTVNYASTLASGTSGVLGRYVRSAATYVLTRREQLYFAAAYLEVLLLPLVLVKFFQGYVGLMGVIVYWQFVSVRYRSNSRARAVATSLLSQLDALVYTYLPAGVGELYHRLRTPQS